MGKDSLERQKGQGSVRRSKELTDWVYSFGKPILEQLSRHLDRRLVQTFFDLLVVILIQRHRNQGLLLSELGGN